MKKNKNTLLKFETDNTIWGISQNSNIMIASDKNQITGAFQSDTSRFQYVSSMYLPWHPPSSFKVNNPSFGLYVNSSSLASTVQNLGFVLE